MNTKALMKALSFMFLPTLGVLLLLLVIFMDPITMVEWLFSDNGWAGFLRFVLLVAEITLIIILYNKHYRKAIIDEVATKLGGIIGTEQRNVNYGSAVKYCFSTTKYDDYYTLEDTKYTNIVIVRRVALADVQAREAAECEKELNTESNNQSK